MIIWGTRGITSTNQTAQFHCPQCDAPRNGSVKQVRRFFTIYFIPLIPLDVAGKYVECSACRGTFDEAVLSYNPNEERDEINTHLLRVMVMAALADEVVDNAERAEIHRQYTRVSGASLPQETLNSEIAMASASGADLNAYVGSIANGLTDQGKALIVELCFFTMSAAGDLQSGHKRQLAQLSNTLDIHPDQYKQLIAHLSDPNAAGRT